MALFDNLKTVFGSTEEPGKPVTAALSATSKVPPADKKPAPPKDIVIGENGNWTTGSGQTVDAFATPFLIEDEARHILVTGTTGSGKSQFFYNMFDQIRERGDKAIIVDHGGENLARYWRPGDIVFNPFDERFPGWSPANEIREDFDHDNMARFVIPDGHGENASWHGYAQDIFASVSRIAAARGEDSLKNLLYLMLKASPESMRDLLVDEPAGALFDKGSEKMAANARSILGAHLKCWRYLKPGSFSIRDWVSNDNDRRWVFVSYKESNFAALRGFISMAVSVAMNYTMDLLPSDDRRIWFSLDEMATLGKIAAVADGLTKLRKYGGCVASGIQTTSQPQEAYGEKGATTLLANYNTYVALRPGDAETAEMFSRHFGEQEVWRNDYSDNSGIGGGGHNQGEGVSTKLHKKRVMTYTDLMMLDDLNAVIKLPGNIPVGYLKIPYSPRVENAAPYIPREP